MHRVINVVANDDWTLAITFAPNERKQFDVRPLLSCEAFAALTDLAEFKRLRNGGYFVAWDSGADLSADTLYIDGSTIR